MKQILATFPLRNFLRVFEMCIRDSRMAALMPRDMLGDAATLGDGTDSGKARVVAVSYTHLSLLPEKSGSNTATSPNGILETAKSKWFMNGFSIFSKPCTCLLYTSRCV